MTNYKKIFYILVAQVLIATTILAGSISGTVTSLSSGSPISNATVKASVSPVSPPIIAMTNNDGEYTLNNLNEGDYQVSCSAQGYQPSFYGVVSVTADSAITGVNFQLSSNWHQGNSISGTVSNSSQNPLGGVNVQLGTSGFMGYHTTTNNNGNYSFHNVAPGTYSLSATKWMYNTYHHPDQIVVTRDTTISNLNFSMTELTADGSLSGVVTNASTNAPVEGARITAYMNWGPQNDTGHSAITDANGNYSISNLFAGTYYVECSADGYIGTDDEVDISGATTQDFQLTHIESGVISGTVSKDEGGDPIAHAYIEFIPADSSARWHRHDFAVTDSNGAYTARMRPGNYYVSCSVGNCWNRYQEFYDNVLTISEATVVSVVDGQTVTSVNFGIPTMQPKNITVSGTVMDDQNNPLAGAQVRINPFNSRRHGRHDSMLSAQTDSQGNYQISFSSSAVSTNFIVSAKKWGYQVEFYNEKSSWQDADVLTAGSDTSFENINFSLSTFGGNTNNSISGNVTDAAGTPLANVMVWGSGNSAHHHAHAVTDSLGNYSLTNLSQGNYYVFFLAEGFIPEFYDNAYTWESATAVNVNGNVTGINAVLDTVSNDSSGNGVTGIIRDQSNHSVSGVIVTVKNSANRIVGYAITSSDGGYNIQGINTGNYTLSVSKTGYVSSSTTLTYNSTQNQTAVVDVSLPNSVLGVNNGTTEVLPKKISLLDNYPNPFNPTTVISFSLPTSSSVSLKVYNVLGTEVANLVNNEELQAGTYQMQFTASNLSSGVYYARLSVNNGEVVQAKKLLLTK